MLVPAIEPRGTFTMPALEWQIPGNCEVAALGDPCVTVEQFDRMRIFVAVDPPDAPGMPGTPHAQVHDDNDMGWHGVSSGFVHVVPEPNSTLALVSGCMFLVLLQRTRRHSHIGGVSPEAFETASKSSR